MTDSYDFTTLADTTSASTTLTALFSGMAIFASILGIIMIISYWKIFSKKGKPGWAIFVPIYNVIVQIQVANLSMVYFLLLLVPFVNIYAIIKINISMAKSFGKSTGFGVGMILLPVIFIPLLAFSDTKEESNSNESTNNFDAMNVINNNGANPSNEAVGIEPIQTVDINPAINNEIPTMKNNVENSSSIENNANNNISNNQPENIQTMNENTDNNGINNNPLDNVPTFENNVVEQNITDNNTISNVNPIDVNTVNNIEQTNNENNTVNNTTLEAPVLDINTNNEVPTPATDTNINNDVPVNNLTNNVETPIVNESNVETLNMNGNSNINAFNVKPVLDDNTNNQNNSATDNPVQESTLSTKKICKSCGSEMPDIVSICPVCGTDNE